MELIGTGICLLLLGKVLESPDDLCVGVDRDGLVAMELLPKSVPKGRKSSYR